MKKIVLLLFLICFSTGCSRERIVDQLKIIQNIGYDIKGDKIVGCASYPIYVESMKSLPKNLYTSESKTVFGIFTNFTKQSPFEIDISKTRSILISKEFAMKETANLLVNLLGDPIIGTNTTVLFSKQPPSDILTEGMKYPPYHISNILEQNMKFGNTPTSNLHMLLFQRFAEGQDMYLPIVELSEDKLIESNGTYIFKEDKPAIEIDNKESLLLKLLMDKVNQNSTYEFTNENNENIFLKFLFGNKDLTISNIKDNPTVNFQLTLKIYLKEYPQYIDISNSKNVERINTEVEKSLTNEFNKLLIKFRDNGVDPVGIGEIFRGKQRNWEKNQFYKETYPTLKFKVKTKVDILQSGSGK